MSKENFAQFAASNGVTAAYSGKDKTMYVKGEDKKVKSFIRVVNLKGKGSFPVRQG